MPSRTSTKTTTKTNDLAADLAGIGLRVAADALTDILARASKGRWSHHDLLAEIVRRESEERATRSLERRLRLGRIGRFKPLADFDWNWPANIPRDLIEAAMKLDFIDEGLNLVLVGPNGVGKTMIARNLAQQAVLAGHSVRFQTTAELLTDLGTAHSTESLQTRLRKYLRPRVLVIDEVGYLSYDNSAADLLYAVLNPRCENRRPTIITTNLAFKDWTKAFTNATCIVTLLDRLTHHADIAVIEGKSYRVRESEQEQKVRQKRRRGRNP